MKFIKFKCIGPLFHNFEKWRDGRPVNYYSGDSEYPTRSYVEQERRCEDCNRLQIRLVKVASQ